MMSTRVRRIGGLFLAGVLLGAAQMRAQTRADWKLMPMPAKVQAGSGVLKIDEGLTLAFAGLREERLERAGKRFLEQLHKQTGIVFHANNGSKAALLVTTEHASKPVQELGEDESYTLEITPAGAKLNAANPLGVLRGLQTFLQLVNVSPNGFAAPAVTIQDQPRFPWRGLMIDCGRHFIPLEVIKRNLDGMEAVKMNVFHWHLTEDQGFRAESHKFPKLHEQGSDGFYYSQGEIREVIAYARDRGIRVVPEFDMPGHSKAWFAGHPELASGAGPYEIERRWGVFNPAMDPTNENTYKFLNEFIGEMSKLFPDQFFHIGGDEVNGKEWDANPSIQEFKKAHHIKDNEGLQAYFSGRVQELVSKHGKTPIGWDEILVPGVPNSIVIQSWRGAESLAAAAKGGYRALLSNGYYIDLHWSAARHYAVDPMGGSVAELTDEQKKKVLGGESAMWSEFVDAENIDSRIWPRNAAIAERLWSAAEVNDVASMYARMNYVSERLELRGLTHRTYQDAMLQRMAGGATPEEYAALQVLAQTLEPVKDYLREELSIHHATSRTPLNRLVDTVYPESEVARRFSARVGEFVAGSCKDSAEAAELRRQLGRWAENDAKLQALQARSFLVKDAAPASAALAQSAELGLGALERITQGVALADEVKQQQIAALNGYEVQADQVLLTIPVVDAIQKLVAAAGSGCGKEVMK